MVCPKKQSNYLRDEEILLLSDILELQKKLNHYNAKFTKKKKNRERVIISELAILF